MAPPLLAELRVPACTAYLDPVEADARISSRSGLTGWKSPSVKVLWFGEIKSPGRLDCSLVLRLPEGQKSKLRLTVAGRSSEVEVAGGGVKPVTATFSSFDVKEAGFQGFKLESLNEAGQPCGDLEALILDGPAAIGAHFNVKPRRNAASVHLAYPVPEDTKVEAFYCEMTGLDDPVWTYYMACGWHRGYFGMQVNSPTERRIIFSVWDSGSEAVDRDRVADEDRVKLMEKGEGVHAGDFGNEGTGGHSHAIYPWKTGETQKFIVTARPVDSTHTVYSGYYFHPEKKRWVLISSWNAPKDGGTLRGLYSFSEDFGGANGHLRRKALYGNQWIRTAEGQWVELTTASFSHDPTGRADRRDRFMGVENGQFFLSHGGFVPGFTEYGEKFTRPAVGKPPVVELPAILLEVESASYLGVKGFNDSIVGARIQSDGIIVLAANLGAEASFAAAGKPGTIVRLSPDGKTIVSARRVADRLEDLALDASDRIYVAAGTEGLVVLTPKADAEVWRKDLKDCTRVDACADGLSAVMAEGGVRIFDPVGKETGAAPGKGFTNDVAIDGASRTVIFCGFRNARAWDGKRTEPVQICYVQGLDLDGKPRWTDYDWSGEKDSERFVNKPENNMADTRADRCDVGRDGKLYVTYQVAGGNHIFRYDPKDIARKVTLAGGDAYHQFHNSRSEHKCFIGKYEPATGEYLAGQQFCGRLSSGRANTVVTKEGAVTADEEGRVYVAGIAASGLPLSWVPPGTGDGTSGGFVLVLSPDLKTRILTTRLAAGEGSPHAIDARIVNGRLRAVFGGGDMPAGMYVKDALQAECADRELREDAEKGAGKGDDRNSDKAKTAKDPAPPRDGFFAVLRGGRK